MGLLSPDAEGQSCVVFSGSPGFAAPLVATPVVLLTPVQGEHSMIELFVEFLFSGILKMPKKRNSTNNSIIELRVTLTTASNCYFSQKGMDLDPRALPPLRSRRPLCF